MPEKEITDSKGSRAL